METIKFEDLIKDPETIAVVGGLLGLNDTFFNYRGLYQTLIWLTKMAYILSLVRQPILL